MIEERTCYGQDIILFFGDTNIVGLLDAGKLVGYAIVKKFFDMYAMLWLHLYEFTA
jgi:hypothetical protein